MHTKARRKILVNIDTVDFSIKGKFTHLGASIVTAKRNGDQTISEYGNRVCMKGKNNAHSIYAQSKNSGTRIFFQGSPFAYKYGQNLYTSGDMLRGCKIVIKSAIKKFNIEHTADQLKRWCGGDVDLTRVDLAVNLRLGSDALSKEILHQVGRQLYENGRPMSRYDSTVYYKPRDGKEFQIVFYAKGPQVRSMRRYENLPDRELFLEHCEGIVRIELRLLASELRKLGLEKASYWESDTAEKVFRRYMSQKLDFLSVTSGPIADDELGRLPARMRPALALHKLAKELLPSVFNLRSRQRQAKFFRDQGIDISCPNQLAGSITSLKRYLSPNKVINDPPLWMKEMGLVPPPSKVMSDNRGEQVSSVNISSEVGGGLKPKTRRFQGKLL